ncbi:3-methyl-2-oxobutanoate hydroxymethyltransferase [Desulfurococcaceae archaeon MEX13E-LK6-19]|nr:3-methyl-2-oxobutanoate hydroxymethyltransferase [Desulfurococcaceae archaeon MEX13E-LK6-19]
MEGKISVKDIVECKGKRKIVMVTAYDYSMARLVDKAGVDIILVGDSLGMVMHGLDSTIPVSMDDMLHHVRAVAAAKPRALIVGDMPFLSYEVSREEAVRNAGLLLKAGAEAVKVEGGVEIVDRIEAMVKAGIPVMGHVGLTPQRYLVIGGYRKRGKKLEEAEKIIEDALAVQEAGAFAVVIEFTAKEVAEIITKKLRIPTICIGSGPACDGQVLVLHDLLGINENPPPFAKKYADLARIIVDAVSNYAREVREGVFPGKEHYFTMKEDDRKELYRKYGI